MEPLEFDFMRELRRGFLDLELSRHSRRARRMTAIQMLKRAVRGLDEHSLAVFSSWIYWYDSTAWERRLRREGRSAK